MKQLFFAAAISLIVVPVNYTSSVAQKGQQTPATASSVFAAEPSNCPHGLEPGGGPMRCADPNDPKSYLNREKPAQTAPGRANDGETTAPNGAKIVSISPDGMEIITADGKHWARRPNWMPSPKEDSKFCVRVTQHSHSASALNRCTQLQNQEFLPSEQDKIIALREQGAA